MRIGVVPAIIFCFCSSEACAFTVPMYAQVEKYLVVTYRMVRVRKYDNVHTRTRTALLYRRDRNLLRTVLSIAYSKRYIVYLRYSYHLSSARRPASRSTFLFCGLCSRNSDVGIFCFIDH